MGGISADEAAQRNDGIVLSGFRQCSGLRGDLERSGYSHHRDVLVAAAAAPQAVQRALQEPLGNEGIPARDYDRKRHAACVHAAFRCAGLRAVLLPERYLQSFHRLGRDRPSIPIRLKDIGDRLDLIFDEYVLNRIQVRDLHPKIRVMDRPAVNQFESADRPQKWRSFTDRVFPSFAVLKPQRGKQLTQHGEFFSAADLADCGDALDHVLIVLRFCLSRARRGTPIPCPKRSEGTLSPVPSVSEGTLSPVPSVSEGTLLELTFQGS